MPLSKAHIKALIPWLAEARYVVLSLGVIAFCLFVSLRPRTPEPTIRLTGLALQVLGVLTVVWGISETRAFFGRPPFTGQVWDWLVRFPLRRRHIVIGACTATLSAMGLHAHGHVTHGAGPNATVNARLEALEKNIIALHGRITETQNEIDAGLRGAEEALNRELQARQTEARAIREMLEATGTGGLHISAIGASWFFVGTVLGTAALELSNWVK